MMKEKKKFQLLTSKDICRVYKLLHKEGLISFPIKQGAEGQIEAIVASINSSYFGQEIYRSPEEKTVAYLYFLIKDHAFTDGNKRTATLCFAILCELNNLVPQYKGFSLDEVVVYIEKSKDKDYQRVIKVVAMLLFP